MPTPAHDIVILADWRQAGPVFWYQRNLTAAARDAGYRLATVQVDGARGEARLGLHPWLRRMIDHGQVVWLDPMAAVETALAITVDSALLEQPLNRPLRLRAELNLVIRTAQTGDAAPDLIDRLETQLCGSVSLASATDLIAAAGQGGGEATVWHPAIDVDRLTPGSAIERCGDQLIVGTSVAGPDELDGRLFGWRHRALRLRGPKAALLESRKAWPSAWTIDDVHDVSMSAFCRELDVYLEGYKPGEGGDSLCAGAITAAASGGVVLASPTLNPYLGAVARFSDAPSASIDALSSDGAQLSRARENALQALRARHDWRCHRERLAALIGRQRSPALALGARPSMPKQRALFFSTNGVGMGHLTRQLAIARRLPPSIKPVFLSMSQACGQVEQFGFVVEFTPYHLYYDGHVDHWNRHLNHLLNEMIAFYDPAVLVFDGNYPFKALANARGQHPGRSFVWCRRGLWQSGQNAGALRRAPLFDLIIEPLDLATVFDRGPTKGEQGNVRCIPPIRLLGPEEFEDRATAAAAVGLDPAKPAVLLQLGSRNNYDLAPLVDRLLPALRAVDGLQIATVQWLISEQDHGWPEDVHVLRGYPIARHFAAFDFSIATPGYNSFHELVAHGMPTIFVPNENASMDDHVARAAFAERQGFGFSLRRAEVYKTAAVIEAIGRPEMRARMRRAAKAHAASNGAGHAASAIEELVRSARTLDAPLETDVHRRAMVL